jgi:hypothetical protein
MLHTRFSEFLFIVLWLIQPYYKCHSHLFEDWYVIIWRERSIFVRHVQWPRERNEFTWHSPVQITIFNFFVVLVFNNIKSLVIIPTQLNCEIESI